MLVLVWWREVNSNRRYRLIMATDRSRSRFKVRIPPAHHSVRQFPNTLENQVKSGRVRAIYDHARIRRTYPSVIRAHVLRNGTSPRTTALVVLRYLARMGGFAELDCPALVAARHTCARSLGRAGRTAAGTKIAGTAQRSFASLCHSGACSSPELLHLSAAIRSKANRAKFKRLSTAY
jgi:hypothetical protein